MSTLPKLFISIGNLEITLIAGCDVDENNFELLERLILPTDCISNNKITDLDKITNLIKKNILIIEHKVNYTFKDIIVILNNLEISFLNLCGFKKLNGTQISKENITYILNSLKSCVEKSEENKKILHIFNSEYCLDKKKLDNLPIGLFGNFYSHELSFSLIKKNDYKSLKYIFDKCNLRIKKILLESFINGSLISNIYPSINNFFYIQINIKDTKIFYFKNNSLKYEQRFDFGSEIILKDISKVTSLNLNLVRDMIKSNPNLISVSEIELLEKQYFDSQVFRKITKKLILKIAEARIKELSEIFCLKNINFNQEISDVKTLFLQIENEQNLKCFKEIFKNIFEVEAKFKVKTLKSSALKAPFETANKITQFGWKSEAIPILITKKSIISRFLKALFN